MKRAHYLLFFITVFPILWGNVSHAIGFSVWNIIHVGFESCNTELEMDGYRAEKAGWKNEKVHLMSTRLTGSLPQSFDQMHVVSALISPPSLNIFFFLYITLEDWQHASFELALFTISS